MNSGEPLRLGVVGMGNFGKLHAATIDTLSECQLAAIVDSNEDQLESAKRRWPDVAAETNLTLALQNVIDGWVIAASSQAHVPIAHQILSAGGKVLIEKPVAESQADVRSIAKLVAPDSSNLMAGHPVLHGTEFRSIVRESRERSPIRLIDAVRHRPTTTLDAFPGESPFHLTMTHDLYCVQVLMNRREPVRFSAQLHRRSDGEIDLALAQLQWDDGAIASLTASFLTPPAMGADGFDRIEAFGDGWFARARSNPRPIEICDDRIRYPLTLEIDHDEPSTRGMLAEQMRCFCRVLRGQAEVPIGATYTDADQILGWLDKLTDAQNIVKR